MKEKLLNWLYDKALNFILRAHKQWHREKCNYFTEKRFSRQLNLSRQFLEGAGFIDAKLAEANFAGARCYNANFFETSFHMSSMEAADLTGVNLSRAKLCDCIIREADFTGTIKNQLGNRTAAIDSMHVVATGVGEVALRMDESAQEADQPVVTEDEQKSNIVKLKPAKRKKSIKKKKGK